MEPEALPEHIGPYRVTGRLGHGGMGEVLQGHDDRLDRPVALKRVRPGGKDPAKARRRFRREARVVARLSHPAIVAVYDWVEGDDEVWLVMERVDGRGLDEVLADGPVAPERAAAIAREVASGLAAAHEAGLVHRDLKAANVMVCPGDRIKILDFGIAKAVSPETGEAGRAEVMTTLTEAGQMIGTVAAMSPEQALGWPVDHRSDLFSLGTLLYEMLTGESPFEGDTAVETLSRICSAKETPLEHHDPRLPQDLGRLVERLLEKEPARRPSDAREVIAELDRLAATLSGTPAAPDAPGPRPPAAASGSGSQDVTLVAGVFGVSRSVVRTLLVSDLVASTRLVEKLGDQRAAAVFERHDRLARALMAEHEGHEVDKSDGFLILFPRPLRAVAYALAYHAALADLAEGEEVELSSRVGIHVGEVVVRENEAADVARGAKPLEVEGLAKAVAARFMSLASGGQTLISRGVYDMARRSAVGSESLPEGVRWVEHGRYRVKGVEEPVAVFEVGVVGAAPLQPPASSEKVTRVPGDSGTYSTRLDSRRWLLLAAAGVLIVFGLWGVVSWIGPASVETPRGAAAGMAVGAPEEDGESLSVAYQRGMGLLERFDRESDLARAMEVFEDLTARYRDSAAAHAGLARALWRRYWVSLDTQWLEQARPAAERAVELDPYLASGHVSLGLVRLQQGDLEAAALAFEEALRLNPASADIHRGIGQLHEARGELEGAEIAYRRALEIRPRDWEIYDRLGTLYFQQSRLAEAAAEFQQSIEAAPDNVSGVSSLSGIYFMQGRYDDAASELQKAIAIRPHSMLYTNLGNIYFYRGLYQQSIAPFRRAVELETGAKNPTMWGNLGDAYRWTPGHQEEARAAYRKALALLQRIVAARPGDNENKSRMALYLARSGGCVDALTKAKKLERSSGVDAGTWFRLAMTYEQCDERQQALAALGQALAVGYPLVAVEREQELDRLRTDPDFRRLRAEYDA